MSDQSTEYSEQWIAVGVVLLALAFGASMIRGCDQQEVAVATPKPAEAEVVVEPAADVVEAPDNSAELDKANRQLVQQKQMLENADAKVLAADSSVGSMKQQLAAVSQQLSDESNLRAHAETALASANENMQATASKAEEMAKAAALAEQAKADALAQVKAKTQEAMAAAKAKAMAERAKAAAEAAKSNALAVAAGAKKAAAAAAAKLNAQSSAAVETGKTYTLEGVFFKTGSAYLGAKSKATLDSAAKAIIANGAGSLTVRGHTDATGDEAINVNLSQQRAERVKQALIERGVKASITAQGLGSSQPVGDNATAEGRAQNRRIDFVMGK